MRLDSRERRLGGRRASHRREERSLWEKLRGFPLTKTWRQVMKTEFNHAANDSPRSGSSKKISPVVGAVIVIALIVVAIWLKMHA